MPLLPELSPEILTHILAMTGSLSDLFALARTSQRIYAVFRREQAALLYQALSQELGPVVLADALGISHIETLDRTSRSREYIDQLLDALSTYRDYLNQQTSYPSPRLLSLEYVLRLVRTYRTVSFVADLYTTCTLTLFEREVRPSLSFPPTPPPEAEGSQTTLAATAATADVVVVAPPSRTERLRILRAAYRLQMVLHVWGSWKVGLIQYEPVIDGVNLALFGLWELWEIAQVFCVATFYLRFRDELADCYFGQDGDWHRTLRVTGFARFWFDDFRAFVKEVRAADEAVWQKTLDRSSSFPSGGAEAAGVKEGKREKCFRSRLYEYYCRNHHIIPERYKFPVSLRFEEDHVSAMPFGWVDAFDGHYEYDFLERMRSITREGKPTQGLWSLLGFVLWDAPRVEGLKSSPFLSHCTTGWARSGRST
jgi:hypothetical protein